jgi:hypothetical protein
MKKSAIILSLTVIVALVFSSCATIETRYTGKRIPVDPAAHEYEYRDYEPRGYYPDSYYDPYYSSFYGPTMGFGFSFWNPFWYYGLLGSYYWGYSPYYWGYSPYYWGRGYYPYYGRSGYYPYRSTYRTYIRKDQLSKGRSYRSPSVRTRSTVKKSGTRTGITSRSITPTRSRAPAPRSTPTRTRTSSKSRIKKK